MALAAEMIGGYLLDMGKGLIHQGFITGQLLIAMPQMRDPRFFRTVIYVCAHTEDGAMGLVINRLNGALRFPDLLEQLEIDGPAIEGQEQTDHIRIRDGGPVETGRGFVLHSNDYAQDGTMPVGDRLGLTATIDILRDIAAGQGPRQSLLALGYAGWGAGQLESELQENTWLCAPPDEEILFGEDVADKWEKAIAKLGVDYKWLSSDAGHA